MIECDKNCKDKIMASFEEIRERIDGYIIKNGLTYRDVSLKIGRKDSYIQQYVKYGFPKRLKEVDRKKIAIVLGVDEKELIDDELMVDMLDGQLVYKDEVTGKIFDFFNIGIYSQKQDTLCLDKLIGKLMFDKDEFREFAGNVENLKIIKQVGDAMFDTISDKALVVYDTEKNIFDGEGVYVIKSGNKIEIKRLQKIRGDEFLVIADNNIYDNYVLKAKDFEIEGRVLLVYNAVII